MVSSIDQRVTNFMESLQRYLMTNTGWSILRQKTVKMMELACKLLWAQMLGLGKLEPENKTLDFHEHQLRT